MSLKDPKVSNSFVSSNPDIDVSTVDEGNGKQVQNINLFGGYITRVDIASSTVTYLGKAVPNSGSAAAVWQIAKIDTTSGASILYADGNVKFDNIWNNRASLSYS